MTIRDILRSAGFRTVRTVLALRRPSGRANTRALRARQESLEALTLRDAVASVLRSWVPLDIRLGHHLCPDPGAHTHVQHPESRRTGPLLGPAQGRHRPPPPPRR